MLTICEELKIIQQSGSPEERRQRAEQLQRRLREDALRKKLRNVRLLSSVERLAERAASLGQLTDRLRLIKRQYEVLATHLPDEDTGDQSQHGELVTPPRSGRSAVSLQPHSDAGPGVGGGDMAAAASPLVEGYYDPRLATRGWPGGPDAWGPSGQRLGRDELGRSTESRAALLRSRLATSLTARQPPPPGDTAGRPQWDHSDRQDCSQWDRPGPGDRSGAAQRDRSLSEYSVSAPGARRPPPAWDGTLDGVASRWGSLERPAAEEQLRQLDGALARQRQLLTAAAEAAEGMDDQHAPLPRLRTDSWLNAAPADRDHPHRDPDCGPRLADQAARFMDQDLSAEDHDSHFRGHGYHAADRDVHTRNQVRFQGSSDGYDGHYGEGRVSGCGEQTLGRRLSQERGPGLPGDGPAAERWSREPRCPEHQALHDQQQQQQRLQQQQEQRQQRHVQGSAETRGGRGKREREHEEGREEQRAREEEKRRREEEQRRQEDERRREAEGRRTEGQRRRAEEEQRKIEEQHRREEEERKRTEEERRRIEEERRREEEDQRRIEERRRREEEEQRGIEEQRRREREDRERRAADSRQQAAERRPSAASAASSEGGGGGGAAGVSPQQQRKASNSAAAGRGDRAQAQTARKKRNMDWLLGGGQSSDVSDDGRPGGSTDKSTGGATEAGPSSESRPAAALRRDSSGPSAAPAPAVRRPATSSDSEQAAPAAAPTAAQPEKPVRLRLDSGSDSYHLSADLGGDDSDDDFWG